MPTRIVLVVSVVLLLILLTACEDATEVTTPAPPTSTTALQISTPVSPTLTSAPPTPAPSPYEGYLEEEILPCTPISGSSVDPCEPRGTIESFWRSASGSNPAFQTEQPLTIRFLLDYPVLSFAPHIVLRGTYIPDTVRCTSGDPGRTPSYAQPWDSLLINCYAEVRVNSYVLGKGPSRLTVLVEFHHYWEGYYAPISGDDDYDDYTEEEMVEQIRSTTVLILERGHDPSRGDEGIYGREVILFVGPPHAEGRVAWEVFTTWNVEQREDGTVVAVHPHRDNWRRSRPDKYREHRSALEIELPRFKEEVLAAHQVRVSEYGGRIAAADNPDRAEGVELPLLISDIHDLDEYLVSTGAYDHPDGTPVPAPPVPGEGDPGPGDIGVDDDTSGDPPEPGS